MMKKPIDPNSYRMLLILLWHCAYSMMRPVFYVFSTMIAICAWVYLTDQSDGHVALWIGLVQLSIYIFGVWKNWHSLARVYRLQEYLNTSVIIHFLDLHTYAASLTVHDYKEYLKATRQYIDYSVVPLTTKSYVIGWCMRNQSRWA